jgi:uncharacterized membrane protein YdjX (TVP38/TMEM64 family)
MDARHWPKIILGLALLGAVVWLFASGQTQRLDVEVLRDELRNSGGQGMALFVLLFALVQPLGVSGHLFVVAAGLIWPPVVAFALSLAGALLGHGLAFLFYRYVAQEWAQKRVPRRLARYEAALAERPFRSVLVLRILCFTWPLLPLLLGVSRVSFWPMLAATALGISPTLALDVWLGGSLFDWLGW